MMWAGCRMATAVMAAIFLFALSCHAREPSVDALVEDFLKVAYYDEKGDGGGLDILRRFEDPVRVRIEDGGGSAEDKAYVAEVVALAARHSGHDIRMAEPGEEANLFVYLSNSADGQAVAEWMAKNQVRYAGRVKNAMFVERVAARMKHVGQPGWSHCIADAQQYDGRPDLEYGHAFLHNIAPASYHRRCIAEEILQALGLPGDTTKNWPSIFTNSPQALDGPSQYDWEYLAVLYDRRLHSGMMRKQAAPLARQIYAELRSNTRPPRETLPIFDPMQFAPSNALVAKTFMDVAFHRHSSDSLREKLVRANLPVAVGLIGDAADADRSELAASVERLRQHVGDGISFTDDAMNAKVVVYITKKLDFDRNRAEILAKASGGMTSSHLRSLDRYIQNLINGREYDVHRALNFWVHSELKKGILVVSEERSVKLVRRRCVSNYFVFGFGPFFIQTTAFPIPSFSVFADCPQPLSDYDLLFLRILVDPRLRPGMTQAETEPVVRRVLAELRPDETQPPQLERLHLKHAAGAAAVQ